MRKRNVGGAALAEPKGSTFEPDLLMFLIITTTIPRTGFGRSEFGCCDEYVSKSNRASNLKFESLILAQDERWRQA